MSKKTAEVELKVYGILLDFIDSNFLSMQSAFSLEEAFTLAKLDYEDQATQMGLLPTVETPKIGLFAIKPLDQLENPPDFKKLEDTVKIINKRPVRRVRGSLPLNLGATEGFNMDEFLGAPIEKPVKPKKIKVVKEPTFKNALMKEILDNNNKKLYEKNKEVFSDAEKGYILERLK